MITVSRHGLRRALIHMKKINRTASLNPTRIGTITPADSAGNAIPPTRLFTADSMKIERPTTRGNNEGRK